MGVQMFGIEKLLTENHSKQVDTRCAAPRSPLAYILWALRGLGAPVGILAVVAFALAIAEIVVYRQVGSLIDRAENGEVTRFFADNIVFLTLLAGIIVIAKPGLVFLQSLLSSVIVGPQSFALSLGRSHATALGYPMAFFDRSSAGLVTQKQLQAASALAMVVSIGLNALIPLVAFSLAMALTLASAHLLLALVAVTWILAYSLVLRYLLPGIRKTSVRRAEERALVGGTLTDTFANIRAVKQYDHHGAESRHIADRLRAWRTVATGYGREVTILRTTLALLSAMGTAIIIGSALYLWRDNAASLGVVAAAAAMALRLSTMLNTAAFNLLTFFSEWGTIENALDVLAHPHDLPEPVSTKEPVGAGSIEIRNVSFTCRVSGQDRLREVNLEICPGEKIGIVGLSGAGKSTLLSTLLRFDDATSGVVLLDGVDIRDIRKSDLRQQITVVGHDPGLFDRSALENIRYGRPDASDREVFLAARRACADEFIRHLVDTDGREGYAARLGERGVALSQGQRQRIAIARALLADTPVLALDEATSALDLETENRVLDGVMDAAEAKTVLIVSHRPSTLTKVDRVLEMQSGRIVAANCFDKSRTHKREPLAPLRRITC